MKKFLQFFVPLVGLAIIGYVLSIAITNIGGWDATFHVEKNQLTYNLIRLAGLTTFVLLSFQVITGTFMHLFNRLYSREFYFFHSYTGILVFVLALLHYGLVHLYMMFHNFSILEFSALYKTPYIHFGPAALVLLTISSATAILAVLILKQKPARWWRYFHALNYFVFILVFLHSINVGTDVASQGLKPLWYFFFVTFVAGIIYKRIIRPRQKAQAKMEQAQQQEIAQ